MANIRKERQGEEGLGGLISAQNHASDSSDTFVLLPVILRVGESLNDSNSNI